MDANQRALGVETTFSYDALGRKKERIHVGRGQSFVYELVYEGGGENGETFLTESKLRPKCDTLW